MFISKIGICILSLFVLMPMTSCVSKTSTIYDYSIGVIISSDTIEGKVLLFDEEANLLDSIKIGHYLLMRGGDHYINYNDDSAVLIAYGTNMLPDKNIMELNVRSLELKDYNVQTVPFGASIDENYIYAGLAGRNSEIIKYSKNPLKEMDKAMITDGALMMLRQYEDKLVAFVCRFNQGSSIIILNREDMTLFRQIDIPNVSVANDMQIVGDNIYIGASYNEMDSSICALLEYNISANTYEYYELDNNEYSPNHILHVDNALYITHYDKISERGNYITLFNINTKSQIKVIMKNELETTVQSGDKLYSTDRYNLFVYNKFDFENEATIRFTNVNNEFGGFIIPRPIK